MYLLYYSIQNRGLVIRMLYAGSSYGWQSEDIEYEGSQDNQRVPISNK